MEDKILELNEVIDTKIQELYEFLKSNSTTYGELELKIKKAVHHIAWNGKLDLSSYFNEELLKLLTKDSNAIPINK